MSLLCGITLFILSLFLPAVLHSEIVDRIIAIVNDDVITLQELEKYVHVEKKDKFVSVNEYLRNIQLKEKIDVFIESLLLKQQAKKLKIEVSDKEVEDIIGNIKKQYLITEVELKEQLKKDNVSYKDFYEGLRMNVIRGRVLTRVISPDVLVTEEILKEYYKQHADEYKEEELKLQQIMVSNKREDAQNRALKAYNLLIEGKPFETVAKEFSDDPSSVHGGDIGYVKKEELIPELRQQLNLVLPGMHTHVIKTPYGFHILKLVEVKKGDTTTFEALKEKIHERIVQEESEKRYKEYINKLRKSSYIEVKI